MSENIENNDKIEIIKEMHLQKNQESETTEEIEELDIDASEIIHCNTTVNSKDSAESGDLSIINSEASRKCRRLELSKRLIDFCGDSPTVQFSILKDMVLIAPDISKDCASYIIKKGSKGSKGTLYNTELVLLMTTHFGLEFSSVRSCRTFGPFTVKNYNGKKVAAIKIK